MQSRETQITMVKWTNAGGQTKGANERSFVYCPPAWRRWRNVKTTYCRFGFLLYISCFYKSNSSYLFWKLWRVSIAAGAFLTDVDRFPWKSQSEFCVVRAMHRFTSLGLVCSPPFFSLPAASRLSRVRWFLRAVAFHSLYSPWGKTGTTRSLMRSWCCPGVGHLHTFLCPIMGFWRNCLLFHGTFASFPKERQMPGGGGMGMHAIDWPITLLRKNQLLSGAHE